MAFATAAAAATAAFSADERAALRRMSNAVEDAVEAEDVGERARWCREEAVGKGWFEATEERISCDVASDGGVGCCACWA